LTYVLSTIFVGIVEGHISDIWGRRRMMKEISKLKDHMIVCGAGRVGREVVAELIREEQDYVVIEKNPDILDELQEDGSVIFLAGSASEDKVLLAARVAYARGVVTTLADDAENLMITIACRDFNPKVRIVARANRPESIIRLKRAGADTVVSPSAIAGSRMALSALRPASVAFVQTLIEETDIDLDLEELLLKDNSLLVGKRLKDSRLREEYGVMLLAIRRGEKTITNPSSAEELMAGDLLILCGTKAALSHLEKVVLGEKVP
jgi:voltage-gated potassium channel